MMEKKMDWQWIIPLFLFGIMAEVRHVSPELVKPEITTEMY